MTSLQVVFTATVAVVLVAIVLIAVGVGITAGTGWALIVGGALLGLLAVAVAATLLHDRGSQ